LEQFKILKHFNELLMFHSSFSFVSYRKVQLSLFYISTFPHPVSYQDQRNNLGDINACMPIVVSKRSLFWWISWPTQELILKIKQFSYILGQVVMNQNVMSFPLCHLLCGLEDNILLEFLTSCLVCTLKQYLLPLGKSNQPFVLKSEGPPIEYASHPFLLLHVNSKTRQNTNLRLKIVC
jgi:hypothetical protein